MSQTDNALETPLARWMAQNNRDDASVAAELNIGRSQVNRLRRGVSKPALHTAKALERLTSISALSHMEGPDSAQDAAA